MLVKGGQPSCVFFFTPHMKGTVNPGCAIFLFQLTFFTTQVE
jgi:hypothetical protein